MYYDHKTKLHNYPMHEGPFTRRGRTPVAVRAPPASEESARTVTGHLVSLPVRAVTCDPCGFVGVAGWFVGSIKHIEIIRTITVVGMNHFRKR